MIKARQRMVGGIIGAVAGAAAAVLVVTKGWGSALDLLAGVALGAVTMAGLTSLAGAFGSGVQRRGRLLVVGLHLLKYPLVLIALYLLLVTLGRSALLVMGGYTLSLLGFLLHVVAAPQRAGPSEPTT